MRFLFLTPTHCCSDWKWPSRCRRQLNYSGTPEPWCDCRLHPWLRAWQNGATCQHESVEKRNNCSRGDSAFVVAGDFCNRRHCGSLHLCFHAQGGRNTSCIHRCSHRISVVLGCGVWHLNTEVFFRRHQSIDRFRPLCPRPMAGDAGYLAIDKQFVFVDP
jgi:hypothetical protein